jgi:hypothetical protein
MNFERFFPIFLQKSGFVCSRFFNISIGSYRHFSSEFPSVLGETNHSRTPFSTLKNGPNYFPKGAVSVPFSGPKTPPWQNAETQKTAIKKTTLPHSAAPLYNRSRRRKEV